ncbi:MAG TPA: histidine--tRNA ligase [Sediminibacterium sp.]|uniref:histidine--tRNA ligase n=1 Tax=Sediminibacterium sp. TaxID=1917865 RepID=UPI0008CDE5A3|nr:histidine--tRNA ligase [Sediminibacterium sp.]OHC84761.1 MAG: histidine--tRNA ligase [Sphingobacteriia bacterium RIFOXYC2_FULL_35_18]OHC88133.1 MAG: histidine--tRNA ligase [Sphingobacteriia bacterium RIFOXYD2_FULL_35_12]HLD53274.1 histidine--tRNA ligase [Sediminibacterium sp.]
MSNKAGIPQGTRDFNAATVQKRNYIFQTIRTVFELYGFQPLETPAMENLDTLMGKYGEEGDKLIFKILNNGLDNPAKQSQIIEDFNKILEGKNNKGITERALRYDLTIPFARYVAMNYGQLTMPFKRYQIQPVWRADRPQKGRYREFYQCDADVVGSNSLLNEVELTAIYATVFERLQLPVEIRINSRKILAGLAELCGGQELMVPITVAIDKLDKIGIEKVKEELLQRGINQDQILIIEKYLSIDGANDAKIEQLKQLMGNNPTAIKGIEELEYILAYHSTKYSSKIVVDFTLARGLNYYTGVIFEIKAIGAQMGSIGGGGRYDDLTGLFGVPNVPGVGISFGVDRIYDVLEELKLFPEAVEKGTKVLFFNLGNEESKTAFYLMQELRESGITAELYHEQSKFDKQFKYAEKKQVPYVVIIGSTELTEGTCIIKNIVNGEQKTISQQELVTQLF